jgi:hypothetical protein
MSFDSDVPEDMTKVLARWRNYAENSTEIENI